MYKLQTRNCKCCSANTLLTADTGYKTYSNNEVGACFLANKTPIHNDYVLISA